ncbi:DUF4442 domain-containing protein [Albibacterium profundi]|uniref:DUF4442 domain-containing protein n=1 Tax=Albibacterium profundi TaxID=3134906 RepID=A0ABV5CAL8_9SPHI
MRVSENVLKWAMRFYPPLFFQRIWVKKFHKGFRGVDVKIHHSILNRNYNGSIFGGTIFSATDPFYAILFDQILKSEERKVLIWLKSAHIEYKKPARKNLNFSISITSEQIQHAKADLDNLGKHVICFEFDLFDRDGLLCASVKNEVYIRNLNDPKY